jgi:hypothetical protein
MTRSLLPFILCTVIAAQAALADDLLPSPPSSSPPSSTQSPAQSPAQSPPALSDDPNFNPNGKVNGNWTSLQPVRPQP